MDRNYIFPTDFAPNRNQFGANSVWKVLSAVQCSLVSVKQHSTTNPRIYSTCHRKKFYPSKSSFYSKKVLNLIKKGIISGETMRNSGIYNYDYAHSFFGKYF